MPRISPEARDRLRRRLRDVCRRDKISRNTLRKKIGLSPSVFYRLFQNGAHTNTSTMLKVCEVLEWPLEGFFDQSTRQRSFGIRGRDSWQSIYKDSGCSTRVVGRAALYTYEWYQQYGYASKLMADSSVDGAAAMVMLPLPAAGDARLVFCGTGGEIQVTVYWPTADGDVATIYNGVFSDRVLARVHALLARAHAFMVKKSSQLSGHDRFHVISRRVKKKLDALA